MFDGATGAGPCDCSAHIDVLDMVGDIAVIRIVLEDYFGKDYIDFHAMRKTEKGWQIMAKVFTEA